MSDPKKKIVDETLQNFRKICMTMIVNMDKKPKNHENNSKKNSKNQKLG